MGIKYRTHLIDFLENMSKIYEIIAFTASTKPYATAVLKHIDPTRKYFDYILTRSHCMVTTSGYLIKDLRLLQKRDLKDIVFIDNLVHSFGL